jgi:hypothetical protein
MLAFEICFFAFHYGTFVCTWQRTQCKEWGGGIYGERGWGRVGRGMMGVYVTRGQQQGKGGSVGGGVGVSFHVNV